MGTIFTHSGLFHGDDVFAVAICRLAGFGPTVERVRQLPETFSPEEGDIAVDLGGRFDPAGGIFDHHHEDAAQTNHLAAAGRVWEHFGTQICGDSRVDVRVYSTLIGSIDRADIALVDWQPAGEENWRHLSASALISSLNPPFGTPPQEVQAVFELAVATASAAISNSIAQAKLFFEMFDAVHSADFSEGQQYLALTKAGPWQEHVLADDKFSSVLFVVFPSDRGGYQVQCVPDAPGSFGKRKPLPKAWGGLRGKELAEASGLDLTDSQALFCHPGLFICGAEYLHEAFALTEAAIQEVPNEA